ncbi:MAG: PP2C family protein-serine/threonine phosphatase [Spirochaetaceae bacterium]
MEPTLLWPKLFVLVVLGMLLYRLSTRRAEERRLLPGFSVMAVILGILLLRDLALAVTDLELLLPASELAVVIAYVVWLRQFTGYRGTDYAYFVLNGLAILAVAAAEVLALPVQLGSFQYGLWIEANVIYLAVALGLVSPVNTENARLIMRVRFVLLSVLALAHLVILLYGYTEPFIHRIILPASYFAHAAVIIGYDRWFYEQARESMEYFAASLESMFDFMKNLGSAISRRIEMSEVLDIIVRAASRNLNADAGAILLVDEYEDVLRVRATQGIYPPLYPVPEIARVTTGSIKRHFEETPISLGETVLGEVVTSAQPVFIPNAAEDPRLSGNASDDVLFVSSLIAVPLVVSNRVLGVISTLKRAENQFFDERDFEHLRTFAEYASVTIDNIHTYLEVLEKREMETELDIAADIQNKLLPGDTPSLTNGSLASFTIPAKGVSGDYHDIIALDDQRIAMVVGDVAGKGIPAALVMVMIRSILHLVASPKRDAAAVLSLVNRGITGSIDVDHYATMGYLIYDQAAREVSYANAAHHPLLIYRSRNERLLQVDTEGLPIGIEQHSKYQQKRFTVEPGDLLVLYTDGVVEAMNEEGRQYGLESLKAAITAAREAEPQRLVEHLRHELESFVGAAGRHDDQTMLVMKVR